MLRRSLFLAPAILSLVAAVGCSQSSADDDAASGDNAFSSNQATLLDFEFDASMTFKSNGWMSDQAYIQNQMYFTIGTLNFNNSVGRLDKMTISNVQKTTASGKTTLKYHVKLPVAWGSKTDLPTKYDFQLPTDMSVDNEGAYTKDFTTKYGSTCAEHAAHDLDWTSMWYYYRPQQAGCSLGAADVVKTTATVTRSTENTTGKYPEYQKVWEDNRLEMVVIFGKYEETGGQYDSGVSGFNQFVSRMKTQFRNYQMTTTPAQVADRPGPDTKDVTIEATLADGKKVKITALLVDAITNVWEGFADRYESLTPTADVIAYNGHAGLGQNVRALAQMGKWQAKKYQIFFMNGCDTFAYVDGSLAQTRAQYNPDDPGGTKYMEFVTNAMPSFFNSMPAATGALMDGLLSYGTPKTYDKIFEAVDHSEVVLVTGEEDNEFQPGMPIGTPR